MKIVLVIFVLSIQSSYSRDSTVAATPESFDTVQFYASEGRAWRVRTYAQDQDVHIWSIGSTAEEIVALAKQNTVKHYGDVLTKEYIIETNDGLAGVRRELAKRGLDAHLESPPFGAMFWSPTGSRYRSKSTPQ